MTKRELLKVWKKLDKGCEAIEQLQENELHDDDGYLFGAVASLKNKVELMIEDRTREGSKDPFK